MVVKSNFVLNSDAFCLKQNIFLNSNNAPNLLASFTLLQNRNHWISKFCTASPSTEPASAAGDIKLAGTGSRHDSMAGR